MSDHPRYIMRPMTPDEEKAFQAAFQRMIRRKTVVVKARPFLSVLTQERVDAIQKAMVDFIERLHRKESTKGEAVK